MNCDKDFYVRYDKTYAKVKPFCESNQVHYKIYLHDNELKLIKHLGEDGTIRWQESGRGETALASQLGRLIEEQQKEPLM